MPQPCHFAQVSCYRRRDLSAAIDQKSLRLRRQMKTTYCPTTLKIYIRSNIPQHTSKIDTYVRD